MSPVHELERLAWQAYADACVEHDDRHAQRAADEVRRVCLLPRRRRHRTTTGGRTLA